MLRELRIDNFALIEEARLRVGRGFNVLTGETGVGKSLVLGALGLLLGGRPSSDLIRSGAESLTVGGLFDLDTPAMRRDVSESLGFPLEEDVEELLIERRYSTGGGSRCRANGNPIGVAALRDAGQRLVDIHGQREHESLLLPANQRAVLDAFGELDALRHEFFSAYETLRASQARMDALRESDNLRRQKLELLLFRQRELSDLAPEPEEHGRLREERKLLSNAARIEEIVAQGLNELYEMDDSAAERTQRLSAQLDDVADYHPDLGKARAAAAEAAAQIEEAAFALRSFSDSYEFDVARLDEVEHRLRRYEEVAHKHGADPAELHTVSQRLNEEIAALEGEDRDLEEMASRIAETREQMLQAGRALSAKRGEAAKDLGPRVEREMKDLAMPAARFRVQVCFSEDPGDAAPHGMDTVEMMLSTNPGEDLKPLRRVGSGGEVARIMLAIKSCLARVDRTPVFVFDEIDANIGGRIGAVIGEKLAGIAANHQVLCITHLPQIAAHGDIHIKVDKVSDSGRTTTRVRELSEPERQDEIAEMIHGAQRTETTLKQAREMLESAKAARKAKRKPRRTARAQA